MIDIFTTGGTIDKVYFDALSEFQIGPAEMVARAYGYGKLFNVDLPLVGVFVYPWGLRLCEGRYLVPMLPFLLMLGTLAASDLWQRFRRKATRSGGV